MPEKIIIGISVEKKIAKADENAVIVCGNSNYKAVFAFDGEWADYPVKTALFATDNKGGTDENNTIPVVFDGNECDIPQLANTTIVGVGVVSGDLTVGDQVEVSTTTPAYIPCLISIKDLGGVIAPPAPDVYDQIIALLNKYIQQGGGGSGGVFDEERVREIVVEETADLQAKTDESLETEDKTVVGAINELNEKKVGFTDYGSKEKAGVYKVGGGLWVNQSTGGLGVDPATEYIIDTRAYYYPLNPYFLDYAVMSALADCRKPEHWTDENKANACETIGAANKPYVDDRFAIIDTVLEQSGLVSKYKATIEDTYNERVTADGANVLDGSKAKLEKVVGSTVACKNLFSGAWEIGALKGTDGTELPNTDSVRTSYIELPKGDYITSNDGVITDTAVFIYTHEKTLSRFLGAQTAKFSIQDGEKYVRCVEPNTTKFHEKFQIEQGTTATAYQPYFTGLKSASFAGIESGGVNLHNVLTDTVGYYIGENNGELVPNGKYSYSDYIPVVAGQTYIQSGVLTPYRRLYDKDKNPLPWGDLDSRKNPLTIPENVAYIRFSALTEIMQKTQFQMGTISTEYTPYIEPNVLDFPKTATPLGVTIDFEQKKITDYGVDLVLTGTEKVSYYKYQAYNGISVMEICQAGNKQVADYVSTDSDRGTDSGFASGRMWCGYAGSKNFFWTGILDILGYTTQGVEPTAEEKATAVANFKAYLAQRYADGNPVKIRYVSSVLQSESDFTEGNEYTAYKGGTESVKGNDNAEYGANNTLSQNYIIVTGVK